MNRSLMLRILLAGLLAIGLALPIIRACAPEGPTLAFTWDTHPDLPLNAFAAGRLGILQPTYARSYLVVAYRYLSGLPLTEPERQGALDLWEERLGGGVAQPRTRAGAAAEPLPQAPDWKTTRARFLAGTAPGPEEHRWIRNSYTAEVTQNAEEVAAATLLDRAKRWPAGQVADWLRTQDLVFSINRKPAAMPQPAAPGTDPLFTRDRAYQIACALFYLGNYDQARKAFSAISQDPDSPWRRLAPYLIGRCWMSEGLGCEDPGQVAQCWREAHQVFKNLREAGLPPRPSGAVPEPLPEADLVEAINLGEYQAFSLADPAGAAEQLVAGLLRRGPDFGDRLGRFTFLLDRNILGEADYWSDPKKPREIPPALLKQDLTEWAFRFRETGPAAYQVAFERWRQRRTLPWLLMALANAEPSSKGIQDLLEAAQRVPAAQPGYETIAFHRARVLVGLGKPAAALPLMSYFLDDQGRRATPSSRNLWRALRMPLSQDPRAFLADALRVPAGSYGFGDDGPPDRPQGISARATLNFGIQSTHPFIQKLLKQVQAPAQFIQGDAARLLNLQVPTEVLVDLARQPELPRHLRREWLRAAWVRAVLLERWDLAAKVTPEVLDQDPELKPYLAGFGQAPAAEQFRIALATIAAHPGLRWTVYQGINHRTFTEPSEKPLPLRQRDIFIGACWWPAPDQARTGAKDAPLDTLVWGSLFFYPQPQAMEAPLFALAGARTAELTWLSADQKQRGEVEGKTLLALPAAPDWIGERVLAWARSQPGDPRIPEALHHAVVAEKVGGDRGVGSQCFKLLHSRYRESPWAARTPIHY
jgi:hypothetical protein